MTTRFQRRLSLAQLVYECDGCGACCHHLILEADHIDALREPRIVAEATRMDGRGTLPFSESVWCLNSREGERRCTFLGGDNRCGIYATRPRGCVEFQAGSEKCQDRRMAEGLPPLAPRRTTGSLGDRLHILVRDGFN